MFKKFSLLFVALFIAGNLICQKTISIRTGFNTSTPYDKGDPDEYRYGAPLYDGKPSFYVAFSLKKNSEKVIHWEPSLYIVSKRMSLSGSTGGLGSVKDLDCSYNLFYANIGYLPVFEKGGKFKVSVSAGPEAGFLFYSKRKGSSTLYTENFGNQPLYIYTIPEEVKLEGNAFDDIEVFSVDFKAQISLSYQINDRIDFVIESQYSRGLTNISKIDDYRFAFNNYSIGAGIQLKL